MRCLRRVLGISYTEHITHEVVRASITKHMKRYEELLTTVKKRRLQWYGQVTKASGLSKTVPQGAVQGGRRRSRLRKKWTANIAERTGKSFATTQALAHDRHRLVGLVVSRPPRERRSRVRIPLAPGFFRGRVIPVT